MRLLLAACLAALPAPLVAAQEQNPSNLYLVELKYRRNQLVLGQPRKLTGDRGRNSQPSFTPDGKAIVFNAVRDGEGGQGDVYRIVLATGTETRVTRTPENENSPTISSGGELLVIRWKPETLFREWGLWAYGTDGSPRRGILPGPDTVGYFMPLSESHYVLVRPTSRFSIALFDTISQRTVDLEWPVARLPPQRIPGENAVSFVRVDSGGKNQIRRLDPGTKRVTSIAPTVPGRTIHTWTRSGLILMGKRNTVYSLAPSAGNEWRPVVQFQSPDLQNVSTYVVSPDGRWLILTSTLKLPLHIAMGDMLEEGSEPEAVVALHRSMIQGGGRGNFFLSEPELIGIGSARRSVDLLRFVQEQFPNSYRVLRALGEVYRETGDLTRAGAAFRQSLQLNPRTTEADRAAAQAVEQALRELTG